MKKQVKILSIILMVVMVLATLTNVVCATSEKSAADLSTTISDLGKGNASGSTEQIVGLGATVVSIMQTVGVIVAVVVLLVLGIKYMMGSAEEKAEYKKTMIPYLVGAVLIFAATTIVSAVYNMINSGFNA